MEKLNSRKAVPFYIAAIVLLSSCGFYKIVDGEKATLISSEKIKNSTSVLVCVQTKDGKRYSFKHNIHCYRCDGGNVPQEWNVITTANGKSFSTPVK